MNSSRINYCLQVQQYIIQRPMVNYFYLTGKGTAWMFYTRMALSSSGSIYDPHL